MTQKMEIHRTVMSEAALNAAGNAGLDKPFAQPKSTNLGWKLLRGDMGSSYVYREAGFETFLSASGDLASYCDVHDLTIVISIPTGGFISIKAKYMQLII